MYNDLLFTIPKKEIHKENLIKLLNNHPEIKFVSLVGVDLSGNDTDEKIPVKLFLKDIDVFLYGTAIQTDGSSVVLPKIATLNNAKIDMVADLDCNWFVDYNFDFIDSILNKPIGTLRIPCFLYHDNQAVDSRNILKTSIESFKLTLMDLFKKNPSTLNQFNLSIDDIEDILITSATELEFWVKTPNDKAQIEELFTSQVLKEQYWTRTKGIVRTSLEQCLLLMEQYGFKPEMGHKEVGGVKAQLDTYGNFNHIMEQLEIDWKYSSAMQAADNELFIRSLVKETFRRNGLEVTFLAKPIEEVAGSGEHIHMGVSLKLKNGEIKNIFNPNCNHFLSTIGYGAIMGLLNNYEIINPFISSTVDSLKRLKPGFEAPVCIVTSLGQSPQIPSRNRTVLVGLIRDPQNDLATRFELRSPNPHTNTYLALAASYSAMLDGISYAINSDKSCNELLNELSKIPGQKSEYLCTLRSYRSEDNIFDDFSQNERNEYFGTTPRTIYENILAFNSYPNKVKCLKHNNVFNDKLIDSFTVSVLNRWTTEISGRIIVDYTNEIRSYKQLHSLDKSLDLDITNWMTINELRIYIMKDSYNHKSLFTKIKEAIDNKNYSELSNLQLELDEKMNTLRHLYSNYKKNLLDI